MSGNGGKRKLNMAFTEDLIAPCGLNCGVCIVHLREKNKCDGCMSANDIKTSRNIKCGIKFCNEHGKSVFSYCFECGKFPCSRLKSTEKRYVEKYQLSLIGNLYYIKQHGINEFIKNENEKWKCKNCGGVLSVHRNFCLNCKQQYR